MVTTSSFANWAQKIIVPQNQEITVTRQALDHKPPLVAFPSNPRQRKRRREGYHLPWGRMIGVVPFDEREIRS
jgi:hypothetical protein